MSSSPASRPRAARSSGPRRSPAQAEPAELSDVLNLIHEVEQRGASVTVLDPHVSTKGEMGQVVLTVLGMVAQMERRFIKERQREGIARAKADGIYTGGKRRLDRDRIRALSDSGKGVADIARQLGCSRMQVYRVLAEP